jgi:D-3-phosphoglycerate dehydrogenase
MAAPEVARARIARVAGHIASAVPNEEAKQAQAPCSATASAPDSLPTVFFLEDHMEGTMSKDDVKEAFKIHDFGASWASDGEPSKDTVALVTVKAKVEADMLEKFPKLRLVAVAFTGFDHVDLDECRKRGVQVANVPGYSTDGVAELSFGLIFSLLRHIPLAHAHVRQGKWAWPPGNELSGKRLGIIGTGQIGMRIAEVGKAFRVSKILGYDQFKNTRFTEMGGQYASSLATLFLQADIVVIAVALTKETRGLVSEKLLKLLRPDSILINCARGAIIDQSALVRYLAEGRFRAGLDVYEIEPLAADHPLRSVPEGNLVTLPHLAYKCEESLQRRHDVTLANILAFFADSPQNIVS